MYFSMLKNGNVMYSIINQSKASYGTMAVHTFSLGKSRVNLTPNTGTDHAVVDQLSPTSPFTHVMVYQMSPWLQYDSFEMHSFEPADRPPVHYDPEYIGCYFTMQQFHRKIHGPWWLLCHCVSAVSCRQKLWPCDHYYTISHYTICSLHSALSLPVQHLTLKQLFSTYITWWCGMLCTPVRQ